MKKGLVLLLVVFCLAGCQGVSFDLALTPESATMLTNTVNGYRNDLGLPTLPFIAGNFTEDWRKPLADGKDHARISDATRNVMSTLSYCKFVETDGIEALSDKIHFSREGTVLLGERYYAAWSELK